jgi:alanine racemase
MGRVGILPGDVETFFSSIKHFDYLQVDGLLTHLAIADCPDDNATSFTCSQIDTFTSLVNKIRELGFSPAFLHLANSAAIIQKLAPCFNVARPGIMLYGISPSPFLSINLKPVLSLKTKIVALKKVPRGSSISYRRTFISERESLIATLPIGYADGYSRQFSNKAAVLIHGSRAPIAGVVCMDMTMVDVTDIPAVNLHDDVVLLGSQGSQAINAQELAEAAHSISYEILCGISSRVPRQYVNGS